MGTDLEKPSHGLGIDGMEDIQAGDLAMPIFKIDHDEGKWVDSLTNQTFDSLTGVVLGVVKTRILWPAEPGAAGDTPICRSYDVGPDGEGGTGYPDEEKFGAKVVLSTSGFTRADLDAGTLNCADCKLKDWGSHPKSDAPWCNEQWSTPILIPNDEGGYMPAIIPHQRTAIKPLKAYITGFAGRKKPFYTATTRIELVAMKKGTAPYFVPKFILSGDSDPDMWAEFSMNLSSIRHFLMTPRLPRGTEEAATPAAPPAAPPETAPEPEPAAVASDSVAPSTTKRAAPAEDEPTAAPPPVAAKPAVDEDEVPF